MINFTKDSTAVVYLHKKSNMSVTPEQCNELQNLQKAISEKIELMRELTLKLGFAEAALATYLDRKRDLTKIIHSLL